MKKTCNWTMCRYSWIGTQLKITLEFCFIGSGLGRRIRWVFVFALVSLVKWKNAEKSERETFLPQGEKKIPPKEEIFQRGKKVWLKNEFSKELTFLVEAILQRWHKKEKLVSEMWLTQFFSSLFHYRDYFLVETSVSFRS